MTGVPTVEERFAARVRAERKRRHWTQQEVVNRLADRGIKLHVSAIPKIESGQRAIRLDEAVALAGILELHLDELVTYYETPSVSELLTMLESRGLTGLALEQLIEADDEKRVRALAALPSLQLRRFVDLYEAHLRALSNLADSSEGFK